MERYNEKLRAKMLYVASLQTSMRDCARFNVYQPVEDDDVVNKRFVQQNMQILKD